MTWYYTVGSVHTRVRVFMNGASCGSLCFRNAEFEEIRATDPQTLISFLNDNDNG